jgi:hypothetical protein
MMQAICLTGSSQASSAISLTRDAKNLICSKRRVLIISKNAVSTKKEHKTLGKSTYDVLVPHSADVLFSELTDFLVGAADLAEALLHLGVKLDCGHSDLYVSFSYGVLF